MIEKFLNQICLFRLHDEMRSFFYYMSPRPEEHFMREDVVRRVKGVIQGLWPAAKVRSKSQGGGQSLKKRGVW